MVWNDTEGSEALSVNRSIHFCDDVGPSSSATKDDVRAEVSWLMLPICAEFDFRVSREDESARWEVVRVDRVGVMSFECFGGSES